MQAGILGRTKSDLTPNFMCRSTQLGNDININRILFNFTFICCLPATLYLTHSYVLYSYASLPYKQHMYLNVTADRKQKKSQHMCKSCMHGEYLSKKLLKE